MPNLAERRMCAKYGGWGSVVFRYFRFDLRANKYRYYTAKEDYIENDPKALNLAQCDPEVQKKEEAKGDKWVEPDGQPANFRLMMKFYERKTGPIYLYSNDENLLYGYKHYLLHLKKIAFPILVEEQRYTFVEVLEKMLGLLSYMISRKLLAFCMNINTRVLGRTRIDSEFLLNLITGINLIYHHKEYIQRSWAIGTLSNLKKSKPHATLRIKGLLRVMSHMQKPSEEFIIEAAKKISANYKLHKKEREACVEEEIQDRCGKLKKGSEATMRYMVHPNILKFAKGETKIPEEHKEFTSFEFPMNDLEEEQGLIRINTERSTISICSQREDLGNCKLMDISSVILNDPPPNQQEGKFWIRINGRRIAQELNIGKKI